MSDEVNVQISQALVKPIIDAKIGAAIVEAIGDPRAFCEDLAGKIMSIQVDENGKHTGYSHQDRYTFVEAICRREIRKAIEAALVDWIQEHKKVLELAVQNELKRRPSAVAKALVGGLAEMTKDHRSLTVKFELSSPY